MEKALDRLSARESGISNAAVREEWDALQRYLELRAKDLCNEVRHYPTPLARCDVQLTKLIEQRTYALESLRRFTQTEAGSDSATPSLAAMRGFVAEFWCADDELEAGLVTRLKTALAYSGEPT